MLHAGVLQVAAELQVEAGVGRVEAALRGKLAQTHALARGLEAALAAVNSEMAGLSRAQQRLTTMKEHLQAKVAVNKSRQQVRTCCLDVSIHPQSFFRPTALAGQQLAVCVTLCLERRAAVRSYGAGPQQQASVCRHQQSLNYHSCTALQLMITALQHGRAFHFWTKPLLSYSIRSPCCTLSPLQVRSDRPQRELVCDEVNRSLARQETLLCGLLERLGRAVALVAADSGKLAGIKQLLSRDLKDKVGVVVGSKGGLQLCFESGCSNSSSQTADVASFDLSASKRGYQLCRINRLFVLMDPACVLVPRRNVLCLVGCSNPR